MPDKPEHAPKTRHKPLAPFPRLGGGTAGLRLRRQVGRMRMPGLGLSGLTRRLRGLGRNLTPLGTLRLDRRRRLMRLCHAG
jgi:hypothetical protein